MVLNVPFLCYCYYLFLLSMQVYFIFRSPDDQAHSSTSLQSQHVYYKIQKKYVSNMYYKKRGHLCKELKKLPKISHVNSLAKSINVTHSFKREKNKIILLL